MQKHPLKIESVSAPDTSIPGGNARISPNALQKASTNIHFLPSTTNSSLCICCTSCTFPTLVPMVEGTIGLLAQPPVNLRRLGRAIRLNPRPVLPQVIIGCTPSATPTSRDSDPPLHDIRACISVSPNPCHNPSTTTVPSPPVDESSDPVFGSVAASDPSPDP